MDGSALNGDSIPFGGICDPGGQGAGIGRVQFLDHEQPVLAQLIEAGQIFQSPPDGAAFVQLFFDEDQVIGDHWISQRRQNLTRLGLGGLIGRFGGAQAGLQTGKISAHDDKPPRGQKGQRAGMIEDIGCAGAGAVKFGDIQRGHLGVAQRLLQFAQALPQ